FVVAVPSMLFRPRAVSTSCCPQLQTTMTRLRGHRSQHATEPSISTDRTAGCDRCFGHQGQSIPKSLMITLSVMMLDAFAYRATQRGWRDEAHVAAKGWIERSGFVSDCQSSRAFRDRSELRNA